MHSKRAGNILLVTALVVAAVFLSRFLGVFALAALTALLFAPLHDWFLRKKGIIAKSATGLTIAAVLLALLLPLFTVIGLSFSQGSQIIDDVKTGEFNSEKISALSEDASNAAGGLGIDISKESIRAKIEEVIKKAIPGIVDFIFTAAGSIAAFVASAIIYFVALATMLSRKYELIKLFKRLSPLDDELDRQYLSRIKSMAFSMVKGTFIIALVVGIISAASLWIIGFPYIAFWLVLFTIMSLIPLGAGIIYVPIGIILLLTGSTWEGLMILAIQFIVLNNVDNVLRPRLAPSDSKLPSVLILAGTFAGIAYFGIVGVVYGPIIMVLVYTTIELYDRYRATGLPLKSLAKSG